MPKQKITNKSLINKLKNDGRIDDCNLTAIGGLSIEELIAVKLELSANNINNRLYGFDIWRQASNITKEAILKFALSTTKSKKDAARFLGLTYGEFKRVVVTYNVKPFFTDDI